ncbi:SUMO ligase siz1 [Dinochytrium kinnereticum]|nr:SUMO ligase siz1 [Dinochytrium kinnereticum]
MLSAARPKSNATGSNSKSPPRFWESPFFAVTECILSKTCDCLNGRIDMRFTLTADQVMKLRSNSPLPHQMMLFMGPESGLPGTAYPRSGSGIPIEYPPPPPPPPNGHSSGHNCIIAVNTITLSTNTYLGMKGKPWTAKPADITGQLHKNPGAINAVEIKVYPSSRRFVISLQFTRKIPVASIIETLVKSKTVSKEDILSERQARVKAAIDDDEVIATSQRVSLKDPIMQSRIRHPGRASTCQHVQCFDMETYLYMNERIPTWICPVCSKQALYENLLIDGFFQDLIKSAEGKDAVESAELLDDGGFVLIGESGSAKESSTPAKPRKSDIGSDDTLIIDDDDDDYRPPTQPTSSVPTSAKKVQSQPEVIDLTSDDEDGASGLNDREVKSEQASASSTSSLSTEPTETTFNPFFNLHLPPASISSPRYNLPQPQNPNHVNLTSAQTVNSNNGTAYPYYNLSVNQPMLGMSTPPQQHQQPQQHSLSSSSSSGMNSAQMLSYQSSLAPFLHSNMNRGTITNAESPLQQHQMLPVSQNQALYHVLPPFHRQSPQNQTGSPGNAFTAMTFPNASLSNLYDNSYAGGEMSNRGNLYSDVTSAPDMNGRKRPLTDPSYPPETYPRMH